MKEVVVEEEEEEKEENERETDRQTELLELSAYLVLKMVIRLFLLP